MALQEETDDGGGVPEWVVTFGDMMSLLLTFFIMLVSLSEIKQEDQYQALVDSIRRQFGYDTASASLMPGRTKPRNSPMSSLATVGRAMRLDTHKGGDRVKAPVGDHSRVRIIRSGNRSVIGTVVYFPIGSVVLPEGQKEALRLQAWEFQGKSQKIEIRGHTSRQPLSGNFVHRDHWQLAYERCRVVMQFLKDAGIKDEERFRMAVAGSEEPAYLGTDREQLPRNSRVEVYMLDEVVGEGAADQNQSEPQSSPSS